MAAPNMIAYQRYNALTMLMAGMKHGELTQGAPIGGMAAVMMYQPGDAYGRSRYNPVAMRAVVVDKLRERLLGLMFVPDEPIAAGSRLRSTMFSPGASRDGSTTLIARAGLPVRSLRMWLREMGRCACLWRNCRRCWMRRAKRWTRTAKPVPTVASGLGGLGAGAAANRAAC